MRRIQLSHRMLMGALCHPRTRGNMNFLNKQFVAGVVVGALLGVLGTVVSAFLIFAPMLSKP